MNIALLGGVKSLERKYKDIMKKHSCKVKLFNKYVPDMEKRMRSVDAVVLFSDTSSHKMVNTSQMMCKRKKIKMLRIKNGSISCLEESIAQLVEELRVCESCNLSPCQKKNAGCIK
ncbi:MAG: hypothetical protein CR982_03335 [Candidatus Cloacimonadota bacterium]|nr:MAG: hypothetical protein CR982_03335 [Candidatus Cloacimonadota bacterium]PIE78817.1 MAG: hypothetical protein CSA15_05790 [Candidatus Delongbacteria bacterium]